MDNWLANIASDVDSLHVEIDNLNDLLVGFCFIRGIDYSNLVLYAVEYLYNYSNFFSKLQKIY
jgi:hypothetical protein